MENARMTQVLVDMKNNVAIDAKTMNEFCKEGQKRAGYYYRKYSMDKVWDLEEFWNEVFIELYENKDKFDDKKAGFSTWFAFKCTHIAVRQLKKEDTRLKYFPLEDAYLLDDEGGEVSVLDCISDVNARTSESAYFFQNAGASIYEEIDKLPDNYRKAEILVDIEGYKPSEAAKLLGCSSRDISNWVYRAHKALQQKLSKADLEAALYSDGKRQGYKGKKSVFNFEEMSL